MHTSQSTARVPLVSLRSYALSVIVPLKQTARPGVPGGGGGTLNIYWWGGGGTAAHPKRAVLGTGTIQPMGVLGTCTTQKGGGGLRHGHESKRGGGP